MNSANFPDALKTAIRLNPNYASAQFSLSRSYFAEGASEQGIEASDIARRLSPCDPLRFAMLSVKANCLAQMGQYQEAMELLSQRLPDSQAAMAALDRAVSVQANTLALDDIFYLSAVLMAILAVCAWLLPAHGTQAESPA